ncbi:MAG: ribonuclease HII [Gammaproteobacteria bacterium]|jgi:ribonuclease HII|nr:ribonuclease HII [Gammaproteobacteria bacterium]
MNLYGGVDEAGRGPLAGPVVAAAVVLRDGATIKGVRDSKQLSPARRTELAASIRAAAVSWSVAVADVAEIDQLNILGATMLAMRRAVSGLSVQPDLLRIDGNRLPDLDAGFTGRLEALVGGDDICPAIGAASILAKVARDEMMRALHLEYPMYGFDSHKGYPTRLHLEALAKFGVSPVHRMSYRPVREAAGGQRPGAGG